MIGRAGRAGFDTAGTAVIMTESKYERKYKELGASLESVESRLLSRLVQVLNTEISQKVITTFQAARDWLATTFLFQSIKRNPSAYGVQGEEGLEQCLTRICGAELKKLDDAGCIQVSKHQNGNITPLFACHVMNQHLVEFSAMKLIIELPFASDAGKLLATIAQFEGLAKPVRRSEKKLLNEVHKLIKYKLEGPPSKVRVQEPHQKAFVLLQAAIGQHFFDDYTLRQEMSSNVEFSTRMLAATEEYSIYGSKNGQVALASLKLRRSLAVSLWGQSDGVMNQLRGVGQEATGKLRFNNISSFFDVINATEAVIEKAAGRAAPFGSELRKAVYAIIRNSLKVSAHIPESLFPENGRWVVCQISKNDTIPYDAFCDTGSQSVTIKYTMIAFTDRPNGCIFYQANVEEPGQFRFRCPDTFGQISVHLVSSLVGLDEVVTIAGNDKTCPPLVILSNETHKGKAEQQSAMDAQDNDPDDKIHKFSRKRIRDPNSVQAGFKRQAAIQKSTPKRSASTAVTPSPMPASAPPRMNSRSGKSQIAWPKSRRCTETKIPEQVSDPYHGRRQSVCGSREQVGIQRSPLYQVAPHIASRLHQTGADDTNQATDTPSREFDDVGEVSQAHLTKQNFNNCTKQSPRPDVAWTRQKREQRAMQQRAFRKEQENPFSKFQYDPNDAENNLDAITIESSSISGKGGSILPPEPFAKVRHSITAFQKNPTRLRSRKGIAHTRAIGSSSQAIPSHMVLRMKGEEQLRYSDSQYFPRPTNPYDAVRQRFDSQTHEHQMYDIHSYAQATPMGVTVSPQPHWQPIWNGSQLAQLPYHAVGPQIVPRHMIQLGARPMYGYSGDPRHQHYVHEQGFDRVDHAEWGSAQGFQQDGVPGHSQYYQPEYSNPSAQAPVEGLLEDAFF
jgi:Sec63 Brl domain